MNSGSCLARSMFCCASGGPYRLNTAGSKQMTHCMRRRFRVALVRPSRSHTALTKNTSEIQWSTKNARFMACRECIVFLQRNGWLWTRVCPSIFCGFRHQPHRSLVASSCMFGSSQRTNSCACGARVLHVLSWRDSLAKTFELQTCATQRKLRHSAMPTGGPKLDSGENCFPLKVANQLASYFYTSPGPIRIVVSKQPS